MNIQNNIELGQTAKDKVTNFTGIITGYCTYITGCDQVGITPKATDDKYPSTTWIDINRIEILEDVKVTLDTTNNKGAMTPPDRY